MSVRILTGRGRQGLQMRAVLESNPSVPTAQIAVDSVTAGPAVGPTLCRSAQPGFHMDTPWVTRCKRGYSTDSQ